MPELPEVETVKRDISRYILGRSIKAVRVIDGRVIRGISIKAFANRLIGRKFVEISRRGKAIICRLDDEQLFVVQLMMTGQLVYAASIPQNPPKETKVIFELSDASALNYNDQRLFGRLSLIKKLEDIKYFTILGPEPFDKSFNPQFMKDHLTRRSVPIKNALMDHTFVAGIGNIYASEILFRSRIDPRRRAHRLKLNEIECVHRVTREVLDEAIKFRGSSMRNYRDGDGKKGTFNKRIKVYAREDEPCESCRAPIVRIVQGGRSTFFCQSCQK